MKVQLIKQQFALSIRLINVTDLIILEFFVFFQTSTNSSVNEKFALNRKYIYSFGRFRTAEVINIYNKHLRSNINHKHKSFWIHSLSFQMHLMRDNRKRALNCEVKFTFKGAFYWLGDCLTKVRSIILRSVADIYAWLMPFSLQ